MNKVECKKYLKRTLKSLTYQRKSINYKNLEEEMGKEMNYDVKVYTAYAKLSLYTLLNSNTDITSKQLCKEIDVIPKIYQFSDVIEKAKKLT